MYDYKYAFIKLNTRPRVTVKTTVQCTEYSSMQFEACECEKYLAVIQQIFYHYWTSLITRTKTVKYRIDLRQLPFHGN